MCCHAFHHLTNELHGLFTTKHIPDVVGLFFQKMMENGVIKDVFKHSNNYPLPVMASVTAAKYIKAGLDVESSTQNIIVSTGKDQAIFLCIFFYHMRLSRLTVRF